MKPRSPAFIFTNDLLVPNQTNGFLTQWIPQTYQLVPEGLVFNLATDRSLHDLPDSHLEMRGLADGTVRFEKDDVINGKILPANSRMLTNRGGTWPYSISTSALLCFQRGTGARSYLAEAWKGLAESEAKLEIRSTTSRSYSSLARVVACL
jgi:hypothetical protein